MRDLRNRVEKLEGVDKAIVIAVEGQPLPQVEPWQVLVIVDTGIRREVQGERA